MRGIGEFRQIIIVGVLAGVLQAPAHATDGYFSLGYGTVSKGLAGAGVAVPSGPLSSASNPATLAFLGNSYDVGLSYFTPDRRFTVTGSPSGVPGTFGLAPGTTRSGKRSFFIPNIGVSERVGANDALGLAIYGNGGMNTTYGASVFGDGATGVDLAQLFVVPTWAHAFGAGQSIGISPVLAWQRFKATGLAAFGGFSADPGQLSNEGYSSSFGYGVRLGYLARATEWLALGASYQSAVRFGRLKNYAGLFAGQGGFDVPATWTAGLALHPADAITVAFDVQHIRYSRVASVGNPLSNMKSARLGDTAGPGFGWRDTTVYKLGLEARPSEALTLRAGYALGNQPIPASEVLFNILAPGVIERHATLGAGYRTRSGRTWNLAVTRAFANTVTGPNPLEVPGAQTIALTMNQWDVEFGYSIAF